MESDVCKYCRGEGKIKRPKDQDAYDREFDRLYDTGQFNADTVHNMLAKREPHEWVTCPHCGGSEEKLAQIKSDIIKHLTDNGPSTLRRLKQELKISDTEVLKAAVQLNDVGEIETVTLMEMLKYNITGCELHIRLPKR